MGVNKGVVQTPASHIENNVWLATWCLLGVIILHVSWFVIRTHCDLVTPYSDIISGQRWLRYTGLFSGVTQLLIESMLTYHRNCLWHSPFYIVRGISQVPLNSITLLKLLPRLPGFNESWWRRQMETFSALLALCAGNSQVTGEFPSQRPVARSFDVFFDLCLDKRLSKQSWDWWFETPSLPLWRHCNVD